MTIARITATPLPLAFRGGGYSTTYGTRTHLDNLLLRVETDAGSVGLGEICRLTGASPKPSDAGFLAAVAELLPRVIGAEATPASLAARLGPLPADLSNLACGLDTACWDILGQAAGLPLYALFGGQRVAAVPYYATFGQAEPAVLAGQASQARAAGYRRFQVKVGGDPQADAASIAAVLPMIGPEDPLMADANGGWSPDQALAAMARIDDPRVLWEEPCRTYEVNRRVALESGRRVMLDQCLADLAAYARLASDGFAAGAGLKPSIQGGPSAARTARDLCVAAGIALKVDDSWAADVASTAALHLALGVPEPLLLAGIDMPAYLETRLAPLDPAASPVGFVPANRPGLGLDLDPAKLGEPVLDLS